MEIKEFMEQVQKEVSSRLGDGCTVEMQEVKKNNGVRMHGLFIRSDKNNASPTIYLDSFLEACQSGVSLTEIVEKIVLIYREETPKKNVDMEFFKSFEKVRDRICYRLISAEKNEELLEKIPHVPFLDLAICFYYAYKGKELGCGTILIYNSHMEMWQTSTEELMRLARENTPKLFPWECQSMEEVLAGYGEEHSASPREKQECFQKDADIGVLSNRQKIHGAACILYPGLLEGLAKKADANLFLLPSSIHEILLLADRKLPEPHKMKEIVCEINATQMEPEEVLSDKIYYYNRSENRVKIIF